MSTIPILTEKADDMKPAAFISEEKVTAAKTHAVIPKSSAYEFSYHEEIRFPLNLAKSEHEYAIDVQVHCSTSKDKQKVKVRIYRPETTADTHFNIELGDCRRATTMLKALGENLIRISESMAEEEKTARALFRT